MNSEHVIYIYTGLTCSLTALLLIAIVWTCRLGSLQRKLKKVKRDKQREIAKLEEGSLEKQLQISKLEEKLSASELKVLKRDALIRKSLTPSRRQYHSVSAV